MLVVDDDEVLLRAYQLSFGRYGRCRQMLAAKSRDEATRLAHAHPIDLAIVDLQLRGECGIDLIPLLKKARPELVVVLVTGYGSMDVAVRAIRAGADEVLAKPVTYGEILARIEGGQRPRRAEATPTLARAQWEHVQRVLNDSNGNISMAARKLGVYRSTLQRWLRRHAPRV